MNDVNPLRPEAFYLGGRFVCRPETPWTPETGQRAIHPQAREVADFGDTRRMECPICGHSWTEELPQ